MALRWRLVPLLAFSLGCLVATTATSAADAPAVPSSAEPGRPDLIDDANRLTRLWSTPTDADLAAGTRPLVRRLPPVFVEHGRMTLVRLQEPTAVAPAGSGAPGARPGGAWPEGCLSVVFLGPRTADFVVDTEIVPEEQASLEELLRQVHRGGATRRFRSVAGAARIDRCGPERDSLRLAVLQIEGPRAAIEVIVSDSTTLQEPLEAVFPERVFGPLAPRGDLGPALEPGPLAERVARAERRARADGATRFVKTETRSSVEGTGELALRLPEGCHRVEVMADVPSTLPRAATDVDAAIREEGAGRLLDRDRGEAADARLFACVGEPTLVEIPFVGTAGAVRVIVSDATWPIPSAVPAHHGARARGGFAAALRRRNAPAPVAAPLHEVVGIAGDTLVPLSVEPGRCYFAAVAVARGEARALRLGVEIGERALRDDAPRADSAGAAFCAEAEDRVVVRVFSRGQSAWWALAVWPMS
ncbi:hypothetical protein [Chondromyces crocatus]|uniref:Secreted protein n=1 Tax=Chondromyces crocatus TaxID=52 RepID=A0A0K1EE65_CHOCO|nr:hypothetical protein [Chondromyces crocatus]AKT39156.1 uncharacterized protein CMC5_033030 [Chondromyces crocatus]